MQVNKRSYLIFYSLSVYVIIQFCWWAYVLVRLNTDLKNVISQGITSSNELAIIEQNYEHKLWMIGGEGIIFFLFLITGIVILLNNLKKEEKNSKIQKDFLLSTSHELKTPVAIIQLYLETLEKRELNELQQKDIIQNAQKETQRLSMLTENILLTTQIEQSSDLIVKQKVDISELLSTVISDIRKSIGAGRTFQTEIEECIEVMVDPIAYESVCKNLIENAIKYTKEKEAITILLKLEKDNVILSVSDEGSGIPDHEKLHVFRKFYRVGSENTRKTKGTGLGLFLVKSLVELHHGKIEIKDVTPQGTCFQVTLPIK